MGFQISREKPVKRTVNRTIRLSTETFEKLTGLARENGISFNRLITQCVDYALDNLDEKE